MNDSVKKLIDDLLVVIVVYKMPIEFSMSWQSLIQWLPNPATIFIYDNSPEPRAVPNSQHQVFYHHNPRNVGVSKAYNDGSIKARELGKEWLLLLDQDTELTTNFIAKYIVGIDNYPEESFFAPILKDKKGILSPFRYTKGISRRVKSIKVGLLHFSNFRAANSGTLIRATTFEQAGGFDEKLPIDFSDIYFQEKLKAHQSAFVVIDSYLNHDFSGSSSRNKKESGLRYETFCKSCITMASLVGIENTFRWVSFKRALRLGLQFFSAQFIIIHFRLWSER